MIHDVVIIGAGPAGLSAALTACYLRLKHVVLEADQAGGALIRSYPWKVVCSFIGFRCMTGREVVEKMVEHVKKEGSVINEGEKVTEIKRDSKKHKFSIKTNKSTYTAKTVLFTPGTAGTPRKLGIPGEDNKNIHYSISDPDDYKRKRVLVVGGGDSALESALVLDKVKAKVYLAHRRDQFRGMDKIQEEVKRSKINILFNTELKEIKGKKAKVFNSEENKETSLDIDFAVICIGSVFSLDVIKKLKARTKGGMIPVNDSMQTNVDGFYAAGDITGRLKRIPEAIGEGHMAIYSIFKYIRKPYWA